MELVYRLATETSPFISQIRDNVYRVGHAGGRRRRARPQRRLVLSRARDAADRGRRDAARRVRRRQPVPRRRASGGAPAASASAACRTGASTSTTTTTATSTCRRCRCARSPTGTSPRIRRSCTTCTSRCRCSTPTAAGRRRIRISIRCSSPSCRSSANWELSQMTKWGMPGVYTHAFMDGWSPGYLGSVAYNHNGMMKMYETQSGRDSGRRRRRRRRRGAAVDAAPGAAAAVATPRPAVLARRARRRGGGRRRRGGRRPRRGAPAARARRWPDAARRGRAGAPAVRRRRRGRPCRPDAAAARIASGIAAFRCRRTRPRTSRAATTRTTCRPACCRRCSSRRCSRTSCSRTSTSKTTQLDRGRARTQAPYGYVIPGAARHDEAGGARAHPARCRASRSAQANADVQDRRRRRIAAGSYVIKARPAVLAPREEPAREAGLSRSRAAHLRRQRLDDGLRVQRGREGDPRQGDARRRRRRS